MSASASNKWDYLKSNRLDSWYYFSANQRGARVQSGRDVHLEACSLGRYCNGPTGQQRKSNFRNVKHNKIKTDSQRKRILVDTIKGIPLLLKLKTSLQTDTSVSKAPAPHML